MTSIIGNIINRNGQSDDSQSSEKASYEKITEICKYLTTRTSHRPKLGIICGSGLGDLADLLEDPNYFPYGSIPHFPVSTVPGHKGRFVFGVLSGVPVVCMQGRFHNYEGYSLWQVTLPVRVMKLLGIEQLIVTNAAGGANEDYNVGDIMLLKDHINVQGFAGDSPLKGGNDDRFGPRFPAMADCYSKALRQKAKKVAEEIGLEKAVKEGVYIMVGGPNYETPAEIKLLRALGADAVGMSTVPEVVVARHCDIEVFAFSLITNKCIVDYDSNEKANHEEVIATANQRKQDLQLFIRKFVETLKNSKETE